MAISTDVLNSVNGNSSTSGSNTASGARKNDSSAQAIQDRFLKLLVAQLNNQDPMNPLDNAQMTSQIAQLNTVTGIENLNSTVSNVMSQVASMQAMQGAAMIGREVLVPGSALAVDGGKGRGAFELATPADNVKVEIKTAGGMLVDTLDLGAQKVGRSSFEWDASRYTGSEALTFTVKATAGNQALTSNALQRARVESVSTDNNTLMLQLAGRESVAYSSVKAIL